MSRTRGAGSFRRRAGWVARCSGFVLMTSLVVAASGSAQSVGGMVAVQVTLEPARGAVVTLFRSDAEGRILDPVGVTSADLDGVFSIRAPGPGTYRVQADADGLASPLSHPLSLEADGAVDDLALLVPSRLMLMAGMCRVEAGDDAAAIVGVVRDPDADVVLPGARIMVSWQAGSERRMVQGVADDAGRYRVCGVPGDVGMVRVDASVLGRASPAAILDVPGATVLIHNLALGLGGPVREGVETVVQEQVLLEATARSLGDLRGRLLDHLTGEPVGQAVVRTGNGGRQALSDAEGRFRFEGVQPGRYALEIRHLGYDVTTAPVEVPAGRDVDVELRVTPQAVELDGIEVTTRGAVEEIRRLTPFRRDIVYGEAMAIEEERGARAYEILRRSVPGLRVSEVYPEQGPSYVCIQTNRRVQRIQSGSCANVQVVINDQRVYEGVEMLHRMPASEIESMEFIPPAQAGARYGIGADVANGVLLVYTRGRGPYVSPLRTVKK